MKKKVSIDHEIEIDDADPAFCDGGCNGITSGLDGDGWMCRYFGDGYDTLKEAHKQSTKESWYKHERNAKCLKATGDK